MNDNIHFDIYADLIGKEFKFCGRGPEQYDCLGLMYELHNRLGIELPHQASIIDKQLRSAAMESGKELFDKLEQPISACLIAFRVGGILAHIGMYIGEGKFIHIERKKRVCIEKLNSLVWSKRIEGYYKFKKRENE